MNIRRMMTGVVGLAMVALSVGFICGCGENSGISISLTSKKDPRESFETFMKSYLHNLRAVSGENEKTALALAEMRARANAPLGPVRATEVEWNEKRNTSDLTFEEVEARGYVDLNDERKIPVGRRTVYLTTFVAGSERYDVRKSDSLVTPYEGILTLKSQWETIDTYDLYVGAGLIGKAGRRNTLGATDTELKFGCRDGKWQPMTYGTEPFDKEHGKWLWTAYERTPQ